MLFEKLLPTLANHGVILWEFIQLTELTHLRINEGLVWFSENSQCF